MYTQQNKEVSLESSYTDVGGQRNQEHRIAQFNTDDQR